MGLGWHTQRKLADKSAVSIPAARFFIDVDGVGGRVLRKSVRRAADVSRCPSTPVPPNFSKMSRKHHTRLLEGKAATAWGGGAYGGIREQAQEARTPLAAFFNTPLV